MILVGAIAACSAEDPNALIGGGPLYDNTDCPTPSGGAGGTVSEGDGGGDGATGGTGSGEGGAEEHEALASRVVVYTEAFRTAAFKLNGNAPTMNRLLALDEAVDQDSDEGESAYDTEIDELLDDPRFTLMMIDYWRDVFHVGDESTPNADANRAAYYAAKLTVSGDDITKLFTATSATCPTFDEGAGTFSDDQNSACSNEVSLTSEGLTPVGVLTDPGLQAAHYGNLAFLRVRFFNEAFNCQEQPIEFSDVEDQVEVEPGKIYTGPYERESIGAPGNCGPGLTETDCTVAEQGRVDFLDYSAVVCANCHVSSNHRAPLFANFDESGQYMPTPAVNVPIEGNPPAEMRDWLAPGYQQPAYKFGQDVNSLAEFGQAMKTDDRIIACFATRVWNYAFSKGDAVFDEGAVPGEVLDPVTDHLKSNGFNLKDLFRFVFTHPDFVRY